MITLEMLPTIEPMTWEKFCEQTPPYSIAIDGYVNVGPRFQDASQGGPRMNLNHHEEVDRFATRATCAQALLDVRVGLFDAFRLDDEPHCIVYTNDCDQDVCTTWFILKYGWLAEHVINPNLNKLVYMQDMLDTTGGAYPFPKDMPILRELAWIYEPYTNFRMNGGLSKRNDRQFMDIVKDVELRILQYLHGKSESISLKTKYNVLGGGHRWSLVREIGAQARTGMLADGIKAFVSVRERPDGKYDYTVARMSHLINFPVPDILARLTEAEGLEFGRWGGGNTIGGSSRNHGSRLTPSEIQTIINDYLTTFPAAA